MVKSSLGKLYVIAALLGWLLPFLCGCHGFNPNGPKLKETPKPKFEGDKSYLNSSSIFDLAYEKHRALNGELDECSGITSINGIENRIFCINDGADSRLWAIDTLGKLKAKYLIDNPEQEDIEEVCIAKTGNGKRYIVMADIGDNWLNKVNYRLYLVDVDQLKFESLQVKNAIASSKYSFKYPDGAHDCEAIVYDSMAQAFYLFTKRDIKSKVFKLNFRNGVLDNVAQEVGELPLHYVVGANLSTDGTMLIMKTLKAVVIWQRDSAETIESMLKKPFKQQPYLKEKQGESICFSNNNKVYYTLSEKNNSCLLPDLLVYRRFNR